MDDHTQAETVNQIILQLLKIL